MNVYRNVDRERIENYLFKLTYDLIVGVVEEKSRGLNITEEDKKFIADFYKYGFVGIMLEWIREGMKENIEDLVRMMDLTLHDTVTTSIHNFQKNNMENNHIKILYKSRRVIKNLSFGGFCKLQNHILTVNIQP